MSTSPDPLVEVGQEMARLALENVPQDAPRLLEAGSQLPNSDLLLHLLGSTSRFGPPWRTSEKFPSTFSIDSMPASSRL